MESNGTRWTSRVGGVSGCDAGDGVVGTRGPGEEVILRWSAASRFTRMRSCRSGDKSEDGTQRFAGMLPVGNRARLSLSKIAGTGRRRLPLL
jgi:hypothetical protein